MTPSASGTLKQWSESSRKKSIETHLGPSFEFRLEFREGVDLYLNIYIQGVRLIEAKLRTRTDRWTLL